MINLDSVWKFLDSAWKATGTLVIIGTMVVSFIMQSVRSELQNEIVKLDGDLREELSAVESRLASVAPEPAQASQTPASAPAS